MDLDVWKKPANHNHSLTSQGFKLISHNDNSNSLLGIIAKDVCGGNWDKCSLFHTQSGFAHWTSIQYRDDVLSPV